VVYPPILVELLAEVALQQAFKSLAMAGFVAGHQRGWKSPFFVPSGRITAISTPRWGTNTWFPADGGENMQCRFL